MASLSTHTKIRLENMGIFTYEELVSTSLKELLRHLTKQAFLESMKYLNNETRL